MSFLFAEGLTESGAGRGQQGVPSLVKRAPPCPPGTEPDRQAARHSPPTPPAITGTFFDCIQPTEQKDQQGR